jgi:K+ transporter
VNHAKRKANGSNPTLTIETPARQEDFHLSAGSGLTIAALGVVYGDIGTSPLYAVRQSLIDFEDLSEQAILGALSLIVWGLVLVVTVKYVLVIMRADNRGEGGLLALTALVLRKTAQANKGYLWIMAAYGSWRRVWSALPCFMATASLRRRFRC